MLTLQNVIDSIQEPEQEAADLARRRWDSVAKPLNSLGALERDLVRIAGVQGTPRISIGSKAIVVMCADNGIVEEGVTQTGQEVTAPPASAGWPRWPGQRWSLWTSASPGRRPLPASYG